MRDVASATESAVFKTFDAVFPKDALIRLIQLQTGSTLNNYKYKLGQVASDSCEQTVDHFLLHCPLHEKLATTWS